VKAKRDIVRMRSGRVLVCDPIVARPGTAEEVEAAGRWMRALGNDLDFVVVTQYQNLGAQIPAGLTAVFIHQIESIESREVEYTAS
jgi:hypothetical protein